MKNKLIKALNDLRKNKPIVHSITNYVTVTEVANSLLALGAAPIMSHAVEDFPDLLKLIKATRGALVLNIGTLDNQRVSQMLAAGKKANELGVPIVLDPVGSGATSYRTEVAKKIIEELKVDIIKGNISEVKSLIKESNETRGVDAIVSKNDNVYKIVQKAAKQLGCVVAITGQTDYISDGEDVIKINNGTSKLGLITGTGCMSAALIGAFCFIEQPIYAASFGIAVMALAGELAADKTIGPGSFRTVLFDELALINESIIKERANLEMV